MSTVKIRPHVLLVFTPAADLMELDVENETVKLTVTEQGGTALAESDLTCLNVYQQQYGEAIVIFHYGGHAHHDGIETYTTGNKKKEIKKIAYSDLSNLLTEAFKNLKLVFINGCNSQTAQNLFSKTTAVIGTTRPVNDTEAYQFAYYFYDNFLKVHPLDKSFKLASLFTEAGIKHNAVIRGGMTLKDWENYTPSVFTIKYQIESIENKNATFESWKNVIQSNLMQSKETPETYQDKGILSNSYLNCNRNEEEDIFRQALLEKTKTGMTEPLFVFIHDIEKHCPFLFFELLKTCTLVNEFELSQSCIKIDLPTKRDLKDIVKCKMKLRELYCKLSTNQESLTTLAERSLDNDFIVIHHDLNQGEWQPEWGIFWQYYMTELAQELEQFSKKLIIITVRENDAEEDEFAGYFNSLNAANVVNITDFSKITNRHIKAWLSKNFEKSTVKITSSDIIPEGEDRYFSEIWGKLEEQEQIMNLNRR